MNNEMDHITGCSEEFAELCALSTSGELSAEELEVLKEHVSGCTLCAALLKEYTRLTTVGMAKLAAEREPAVEVPFGYNKKRAEERFVAALRAAQPTWRSKLQSRFSHNGKRLAFLLAIAACLVLCIGGGVEVGRKTGTRARKLAPPPVAANKAPAPDSENARLKAELEGANESLAAISAKSSDLEKRLAELTETNASLSAQIDDLTKKDSSDAASLATVTQQRDGLQQQLNDASAALIHAKEDLNRAQQDRQGALFRLASLETQIDDLHSELAATNRSAGNDEQFLAADRDIRELMGARELYIADVFDVQHNGERSKPFGRVFYTKGKSLIFYAFDLQAQPGYREAKAFQAWGKTDSSPAKPISLGIFYEDNEKNRRWVVKSDNAEILTQINAVFVTVEPKGGSAKPTGKPFLEAYLHSLPPNHP